MKLVFCHREPPTVAPACRQVRDAIPQMLFNHGPHELQQIDCFVVALLAMTVAGSPHLLRRMTEKKTRFRMAYLL